jgi:hypothetical protein
LPVGPAAGNSLTRLLPIYMIDANDGSALHFRYDYDDHYHDLGRVVRRVDGR